MNTRPSSKEPYERSEPSNLSASRQSHPSIHLFPPLPRHTRETAPPLAARRRLHLPVAAASIDRSRRRRRRWWRSGRPRATAPRGSSSSTRPSSWASLPLSTLYRSLLPREIPAWVFFSDDFGWTRLRLARRRLFSMGPRPVRCWTPCSRIGSTWSVTAW